jgi:hypothetical protein
MLKWITSIPTDRSWQRWLTLPDPETLLRPNVSSDQQRGVGANERFSQIVSTIWIDGINKRTRTNRLQSSLNAIRRHWRPAKQQRSLSFLDLGASDGINTSEAAHFLRCEYQLPVRAVALDKYLTLHRHDGSWLREYRAANGDPVLLRCGRIGLRLGRRLALWPAEALRRFYLRRSRFRSSMARSLSIPLVHPQALIDSDLKFFEGDAFARKADFIAAFDIVRASNFLNLGYFSAEEITRAVRLFHEYLRPQGLLIVSRNVMGAHGEAEQGTLWRRTRQGFDIIGDFGGGSEIQSLVAQIVVSNCNRNESDQLCIGDAQVENEYVAA